MDNRLRPQTGVPIGHRSILKTCAVKEVPGVTKEDIDAAISKAWPEGGLQPHTAMS